MLLSVKFFCQKCNAETEQARNPPCIDVKRFRGGLVCKAHRLLYHSTLGPRVIKKKKKKRTLLVALELSGRELELFSTVPQVNRGSTFALGRSTLDFYLAGQRSALFAQ